eukprot:5060934-Alexandrium_andersonii.AAC.1
MRQGDTFDACVSLLYKFVGKRQRKVIQDHQDLRALLEFERVPFQKILDPELMDTSRPPPGISLRAELISRNSELMAVYIRGVGPDKSCDWFHWED